MHKFWLFVQKANEAMSMGKKWQESILDICDQHFFFTQVCLQPPLVYTRTFPCNIIKSAGKSAVFASTRLNMSLV